MIIKGIIKTRDIFIDGKKLSPKKSQQVINHSPDGFNWGYSGSGPAQLSLAILLEITDIDIAKRLYQAFKWEFITNLSKNDFTLVININKWLKMKKYNKEKKNNE